MRFCLFLEFDAPAAADVAAFSGVPGCDLTLIHTPASAHDPFLRDGAPPGLVVQLYFAELGLLEAASPALAGLVGTIPRQQAMLTRRFAVPSPDGAAGCTYLVAYEGAAADETAWLGYYLAHHPPLMARLPGIRGLEIYTRVDWVGGVDWPRADCLQRNKVVFDDPAALTAALNSPIRAEMRADYQRFPAFSGRNTHYPLLTVRA